MQDVDSDGDGDSDVWLNSWPYEYRDIVLVDDHGGAIDVYGLTKNDLAESDNYNELKQMFLDVADIEPQTRWQSPVEPLDVDGNSRISPIDALHVINELGKHEDGILPSSGEVTNYVDSNGDGRAGPIDALLVINQLNIIAASSAQAAPVPSAAAVNVATGNVVTASPVVLNSVPANASRTRATSENPLAAQDSSAAFENVVNAPSLDDIENLPVRRFQRVELARTTLVSKSSQDSVRDGLFGLFGEMGDVRLL